MQNAEMATNQERIEPHEKHSNYQHSLTISEYTFINSKDQNLFAEMICYGTSNKPEKNVCRIWK